ncbi:MAG TPA: hypothetical protein VFP54_08100 [Acidimicrobiales bacterium]|nr:hypothetical protein [Acidimicrobiales bacterium]
MSELSSLSSYAGHPSRPLSVQGPRLSGVDAALRYQVRQVIWGDHKRFEVRDTVADETMAIRSTLLKAEDDVIVLTMAEGDLTGIEEVAEPQAATRLCGRCRGIFPADPDRNPSAMEDWWLCGPCHEVLIGPSSKPNSAPGKAGPRTGPDTSARGGAAE